VADWVSRVGGARGRGAFAGGGAVRREGGHV